MEGGIDEQDFKEIEMLLGEIPNATYGNHLRGQTSTTDNFQKFDTASIGQEKDSSPRSNAAKHYNFHYPASNQGNETCTDGVEFSKCPEILKFFEVDHTEDSSNLQDERSLTLLLEEMRIKEIPPSKLMSRASFMNKQKPFNQTFLLNEQIMNAPNQFHLGYGPVDMNFPQSGALNGVNLSSIELEARSFVMKRNELANLSDKIDGHFNVNLFKSDDIYEPNQISESLLGSFSEHHQVFPVNTMSIPLNSCLNTHQLLPSAQELQLPGVFQPNYCVEAQSSPRHIARPGMEEERYGRHYQQFLYAQHLQNQRPEFLQFLKSIDCGMVPFNGNTEQSCFEFPIPQQFQHCKDPHLNPNAIYDKSNLLDYCQYQPLGSSGRLDNLWSSHGQKVLSANGLSCSAMNFQGHHIFDKFGKQCFPKKILTRSHGVNSVRALRPNPFATDKPFLFDKNSLRWSNGNDHQPHDLNNGSLKFNNQRNKGSSPSHFYSGLASKSMQKRNISVDGVAGRICLMAKDQHGCRFLQRKFVEGCQEDINMIFSEIIFHIAQLMTDPFGNYLVQKLLEVCNEEQMMLILKVITRNTNELIRISCDMHGTRALQKIIETVRTPEQISIVVSSLEPCIISVMKDVNGNHVAQRCLQYLSKYSEVLIDAAITHCVELATDRQGCCVLQKCLMHADVDQKQMLIAEISAHSLILSKDQFGNYVVQFVLDLNDPWAITLVLKNLMGNYEHLSLQKYSSNVVERCLNLAEEEYRIKIIQELMRSPLLSQILQDPYGNYVIQTALSASKVRGDLHADLLDAIVSRTGALRSSPFGKKVIATASLYLKK